MDEDDEVLSKFKNKEKCLYIVLSKTTNEHFYINSIKTTFFT